MSSLKSSAAAPLRGRREHRKNVTRRELLAAGRRLFGEKGLYESRIEDLTRYAGIAKGTLYGYFANKKELIEAVVTSGLGELLGHAHREAQDARTHAEVVARLAEAHLAFFEDNPDLMRIFHQVRGLLKFNRPEGLPLRRALTKYLEGLAHVLALRRPVSRGREGENIEAAILLFGAVSGISSTRASLAKSAPRPVRSRATIRALVALILAFENRADDRTAGAVLEGVAAARTSAAPRRSTPTRGGGNAVPKTIDRRRT